MRFSSDSTNPRDRLTSGGQVSDPTYVRSEWKERESVAMMRDEMKNLKVATITSQLGMKRSGGEPIEEVSRDPVRSNTQSTAIIS